MPERNPRWCERHWSPCPGEGLNGILVTVRLAEEFVDDPRIVEFTQGRAADLNRAVDHFAPLCCFLGDERMEALWNEARELKQRAGVEGNGGSNVPAG